MGILKFFTTRNAFSREYGTWLIILFNLAFVPFLLQRFPFSLAVYSTSIIFFLIFRFELMDYISIEIQFSKKTKVIKALLYLLLSGISFLFLVIKQYMDFKIALLICFIGIGMLILNITTRRKKGKRQNIFAQILLIWFIAFLNAMSYYLITGLIDKNLFIIFISNGFFYSNSVIYVRSKTNGSPYDVYALLFSFSILLICFLSNISGFTKSTLLIAFIPTLVKTLDNVILTNIKVPLRRIGINETIHCIIFMFLFRILYHI